jgi:YbbR domain-containing protein
MIRRNLSWKLFALLVTIALWGYVNTERNPQSRKVFTVPIETRNLGKGYMAELLDSHEATIALQGASRVVDGIRRDDVKAWVSLREPTAGQNQAVQEAPIRARVAGVAQDDLSVTIVPTYAKVRVEAVRLKRLPVEVKFLSPPPLGYSYSQPEIDPSSLSVSGKSSSVSRVSRIIIGMSGRSASHVVDEDFKPLAVDAKGNVVGDVDLDEPAVHLKLRFVEAPATKVVFVSPTIVGQPKFPAVVVNVRVSPPSVTLQGRPAALLDLSTVSTEPIDIEGAQANVAKDATLRIPDAVRLQGRRSVKVTVFVASSGKN